jgi:putative ABC transport system permease protein
MSTPLAWHNLAYNKPRTLAVLAGVTFAVVLIFMQLGFFGAVETTATVIYDALDFDLAIRSRDYLHFSDADTVRHDRLHQAAGVPGVARVQPFQVAITQWRHPTSGRGRAILVMGIDPAEPAFTLDELRRQAQLVARPNVVLVDRKSRREFGPRDGWQFGDADVGVRTEVGPQSVTVGGHFGLGTGLAADGAVVTSDATFARLVPGRDPRDASLGLVTITPGANPDDVARRLRDALPGDVDVLTRAEVLRFELRRWISDTSIGVIFQVGVAVAMVVGMAIVYQVLASDIGEHMAEYATLRAMGYTTGYLARVVMHQSLLLAVLGFVPGLLLSDALYRVTSRVANMPIGMNAVRVAAVFGLSLGMCIAAGLIALRRVRSADPADLF